MITVPSIIVANIYGGVTSHFNIFSIEALLIDIISGSMMYLSHVATYTIASLLLKDIVQQITNNALIDLSNKLKLLDVNTNLDLLKEAKLIKTEYHFKEKDDKKRLIQDKYIEIKTKNNIGKEFEETLLQEHELGTRNYELSVGSPQKKLSYKHVKRLA